MNDTFYIGWLPETPAPFKNAVRRLLLLLGVLVPALALGLAAWQKGFSNGVFEYGKTTALQGVYTALPAPFLTLAFGQNSDETPIFQKILLVGQGKSAFLPDTHLLKNFDRIEVSGFLIYNEGKTAFQVEEYKVLEKAPPGSTLVAVAGNTPLAHLSGEIADPKCLLGVMNPAQGKPHRDCAVRCISGGLPPVLRVANAEGAAEYYLLVDEQGNLLNNLVLPYVGDVVSICGRLERQADWWICYTDPNTIQRIEKWKLNPGPMCN